MGPEQPIDPQGDPLVQELVADDDEGGGQEETARGKPDSPGAVMRSIPAPFGRLSALRTTGC